MKKWSLFLLCIFSFFPSVARAHGLYLNSQDGKLCARFSDHSPASGAEVTVVDEDGIVIVRDTLDEKGTWTLPENLEEEPKYVIVEAPGGHLTRLTWEDAKRGTSKGFFDHFSVRIALGIAALCGGGFILNRLLNPKFQISNPT